MGFDMDINADYIAQHLGAWAQGLTPASCALRILLVLLMATVLGCERARNRHAAGLRTFIVVALVSMFSGIADLYLLRAEGASFAALSAGVAIGTAVISTNSILFSSKNQLKGLTTAVVLFGMAIIGILVGLGLYTAGILGYVALLLCLVLFPKLEAEIKQKSSHFEIHLELHSRNSLQEFVTAIRAFGLKIDDIEVNPAYANTGLGVYSVSLTVVGTDLKKKPHKEIIAAVTELDCVSYIEEL